MTLAPLTSQSTESWSALAAAVVAMARDPFEDPRFDGFDEAEREDDGPDEDEPDYETEEQTTVDRPAVR